MLKINLRPSWELAAILAVAHGAAIAAVVVVEMPLWLTFVVMVALIANLSLELRHASLRMPDAVVAIEVSSDNVLSVQTRRGESLEYEVLGNTYVLSFLAILNLKQTDSGASKRVVILPDSIAAEDFRKLRVWLRWKERIRTPEQK